MTTHMVRVGYWLQFGSFLHWASQNILQIIYPINAQSQILWTVLMTGSDHLAGFVQFMGIPIGGISIIGICRLLNYSRPQSVFAGLLWMTLPEIILQSTTTQNDLVVSGLIIACVYFLYDGLISGNSEAFVLSSLALGLALGTKQTTFFILPGLGLICLIIFLTHSLVRTENRLRAVLLRYYPAALEVFSSLDAPITLAFIQEYTMPQAAAQLTFEQFKGFLKLHRHHQPKKWAGCYARLQRPQPQADPAILAVYSSEARLLAHLLDELAHAKTKALQELEEIYLQHPEHEIYDSLPGVGPFLGPALLSKFGDDRQRFPSSTVVQAIAGTCPVTVASGKKSIPQFRLACDHEFRYITQQWAKQTIHLSPWTHAYYAHIRPHYHSDNDAYRRLANRRLEIVWKLWMDRKPYNETKHLKQKALRSMPRS